jgi:hypothetical protein
MATLHTMIANARPPEQGLLVALGFGALIDVL